MINGKIHDKLEGCLEFLEFGRYGRALDYKHDNRFYYNDNTTYIQPSHKGLSHQFQHSTSSNHRRNGRKLKNTSCHCEYDCLDVFIVVNLIRVFFIRFHYQQNNNSKL